MSQSREGCSVVYLVRKLSKDSSFFLNIMRLLACQMVLIGHILIYCRPVAIGYPLLLGEMLAGTGVIIFFIISGLLISRSMFSKMADGGYNFGSYFLDRFARIYSGLIPCLVIITLADLALNQVDPAYYLHLSSFQRTPELGQLGLNLLMLQQFDVTFLAQLAAPLGLAIPSVDIMPYGFDVPLWTLAIEWWLYMLFGWVVIGVYGRKVRSPVRFILVLAFLLLVLSGFLVGNLILVTLWFVGVAITFLMSYPELRNWTRTDRRSLPILIFILMTSIVGSIIRVIFALTTEDVLIDPVLAVFLSMILFSTLLILDNYRPGSEGRAVAGTSRRLLTFGAAYSYTLYLVHFPLLFLIDGALSSLGRPAVMLIVFFAANLISVPVAYLTEMKHRKLASWLKDRLGFSGAVPEAR
jgi:peptidoglycan/LPS O-acetylase OafA/YrhL